MYKVSLSIQKHRFPTRTNVLEQLDENERLRERLKVTRTNIEDTGMLRPEYHKPRQVPSLAASIIG